MAVEERRGWTDPYEARPELLCICQVFELK